MLSCFLSLSFLILEEEQYPNNKKAEKTLPQLTTIKSFPTTLFIGKSGAVRDIHSNFYGPGSGEYYDLSKKRLTDTVNRLLEE